MKAESSSVKAVATVLSFVLGSAFFLKGAAAEKILSKDGDWTVFSEGRAGAFASYARGDGFPYAPLDASGNPKYDIQGGGAIADVEQPAQDPNMPSVQMQGKIERLRLRSGMIGNTFGFGVRGPFSETTTVKAFVQIWAFVESTGQEKTQINYADVRQGYVKLEGPWGTFLVGRTRGLFSRGATDIDVMYAHGFGVGYPGSIDTSSPGFAQGHIGFGVLGSGFASGVIYGTPSLAGVQLNVGAFDPVHLQGAWSRTKWPRAEAELTVDRAIGQLGKIVLFGNGAYQRVYQNGAPDSQGEVAKGVGYGGRVELGPVRLGVAGHYGHALGLNYALEPSAAAVNNLGQLRWMDGYYAQSMLVIGKVDISAGWGISRVFLNSSDNTINPATGLPLHSVIKYQQGTSCGVVYHVRPWLHVDVDYFRANFAWFLGEKQVDHFVNSGMMFTW